MSLVSIQGVHVAFGGTTVLENVSLEVLPQSRLGIVGPNGGGKTTLLRVLLGVQEPDDGTVGGRKGLRVEWLRQDPELDPARTPREVVLEGFADLLALERKLRDVERAMGEPRDDAHLERLLEKHSRLQAEMESQEGWDVVRRAEEALSGLGVPPEAHDRPVDTLSGGQQTRVGLARVLVREPELLVLDEPTNHLDLVATEWLEERLIGWRGAFLVVSHDRHFLDRVARTIAEVDRGRVVTYAGNYSAFEQQREIRIRTEERAYEKQRREIAHDEDFVARNIAAARVSMARGRRKKLAKIERLEAPTSREKGKLGLDLGEGSGGSGAAVTLDRTGHAYEEDRWLFRRFSFRLERGETVGVIGPNGGGKTTLLRILAGLLEPAEGSRREGKAVRRGLFEQDRNDLDPEASPLEVLREVDGRVPDGVLRSWLGRFRITGDDSLRPVSTLSGGEAARVALAKLLYAGPNVLYLDEPTNHLDIPSREALEDALNEFPGTVLLVSHDRRLLDRTADRIVHVGDGVARFFHGGYTAYQEKIRAEREEARQAEEEAQRRRRAENLRRARAAKAARSASKRPRIQDVENEIITREERLEALHEEMALEHVYRDAARMKELTREREALEAELADLNARWEELAG
jgi:ATP-binding cassette subfamily F protein 3